VNGQAVAGSPFPVFVSIHPTLLGKPVRVITGVKPPRDVAVTPTGNILVTESGGVSLFDENGKKLRNIDTSKNIANPRGVTVASTDGCIYICGETKIIKLGPDFKLVGEFTGQGGSDYQYVAVVGDEVMVSDNGNKVVMVYTKYLEYVRQVGSHGEGPGQFLSIRGVSSDGHNLYVSEVRRGCVHVFSSGEYLHSFGQSGDGVKKLSGPIGVCVVGQYVYVASHYGHRVSVFTTEGEHVTSFGECGISEGNFIYPRGVCVDKDGFVYVCDSNTVQIF
jgi:tripartite motif-containing protein 2/3/tripartite motif-containing protein 71